jgi:hypothetical protein
LECLEIVQDPFGNYAIQFTIETYGYDLCLGVIQQVYNNMISLSIQKFSSNVVEKCIELSSPNEFQKVIKDIFLNQNNFSTLLRNKYGNFVLQKTLSRMSYDEKVELKEDLSKRGNINSGKEKQRLNALLEIM